MTRAILLTLVLCVVMVGPYLPGRFDASAATLSFVAQVAGYLSLLLVPVGLVWMVSRRRSPLWYRLALGLTGFIVFVISLAAVAVNQLTVGMMVGIGGIVLLRKLHRRRDAVEYTGSNWNPVPLCLVWVPLALVTFRTAVLPAAANWSRDRAITHSATLIDEIESFHQRRGHYPVSLQSLNRDFPTGVVGIERFHYEPNGETYNLFFIRQHIELDAMEVVLFNPRDEHRFASHELDILRYDGEELDRRRGDRRRTPLARPHWISILFD